MADRAHAVAVFRSEATPNNFGRPTQWHWLQMAMLDEDERHEMGDTKATQYY